MLALIPGVRNDSVIQPTEPGRVQDEDGIYLVDIIRFVRRHRKFLLLTTVVLSAIAIPLSLLQPKPYQKQLTLSVKPLPVLVTAFPALDVNQAGTLAINFLQNSKLNQMVVSPTYDPVTQQIKITMRSLDSSSLESASASVASQLKTGFENIMEQSIQTSLTATQLQLKRKQRVLDLLEQQKAKFSPTNEFRLSMVESYRVQPLADIAELEFDKQYLEQAQKNLAEFTAEFISIQILAESVTPQTRSPVPIVVVSVIASFIAAVFAALIREQILRLRDELSGNKIDSSQNV
jgi:riboflavin transporter FmnP